LANYPNRDGRLANGVGLDTPASCVEVLKALKQAGYDTGYYLPADSAALIACLSAGVTNDPEGFDSRPLAQWVDIEAYQGYFATLSGTVRTRVEARWGAAPGEYGLRPEGLPVSGVRFGNVFVAIQPARGYDSDPQLNYHAPDLEPPHPYFAFYYWLREVWGAHAVVHLGKHGNLEWLPGKANALSAGCFPEAVLGALPHLYPFIVNDPGEGTQAKRRTAAVILDHLTPPMARAETYGPLLDLENVIDEYHEAASLDPARLPALQTRLLALIGKTELHRDLGLAQLPADLLPEFLTSVDGYLCEIKEMQIRDGLHIFGQAPEGEQLCGLLVALARPGSPSGSGITQALALDLGLDFDPLVAELGEPYAGPVLDLIGPCRTVGDVVEGLERFAHGLMAEPGDLSVLPRTREVLDWVTGPLLTALMQTDEEMVHLLAGLDGRFVPAGPSGAPTRGRPEVLPTGRNFYSVDVRAIPTPGAWDVGRKAAEALVERYTQEHGEYPRSLGLSVWGTSTMRTGGDDLAEALALIGAQPVWDRASRRVTGFEVIPVAVLGRPRVDVTLRISGFFRDAFANLIGLFDDAVRAVANCDEADEDNPLRAQVQVDRQFWVDEGLPVEEAEVHSRLRIFGSKPGAYGAGLQGLIESRCWQDDGDLARAYLNWSGYAYTRAAEAGISAPAAFARRLGRLAVVLHNQDNREHDLLDSDDYYQFQGGMTAAVRSLSGRQPVTYFGDHSRPQAPKVRSLHEEVSRVYRARVVNPKWIRGMMRHGYKGAFELSATVDYLFAYDATAQCVEDFMYQGVAESYLFDPEVQQFVRRKNPWVLRDMAERLLEAHQRGLWSTPTSQTLDTLRGLMLEAEAWIETHNDGTMPRP
ncbi:MAG: cobaltochelatase subunit CobN, partial [Gemmatimonadaceae bacterium]|nr:cobaltochelatase subunit CobN [Gloeobacterales cyanobacterium ES-bin-141]